MDFFSGTPHTQCVPTYLWFFFIPGILLYYYGVWKKRTQRYTTTTAALTMYIKKNSIIGENDRKKVHNRNVYTMI